MRNLNRIHLSGLRAVEAAGRLGSLRAAADELGVTPGAVSQQIQKTEMQLGRPLFQRRPGGMMPTDHGAKVIGHLTSGMSELSAAVAAAEFRQEDILTVSAAPVFAGKWLVWRLTRFNEKHPDIHIRLDATGMFVNPGVSDVDVCIRVGKGQWPDVDAEKLFDQIVFPVCSAAIAERLSVPQDLSNVPIIRDQHEMFGWDTWLKPNGLDASVLGDGPSFSDASLCLDAAIAGQGVFLAWDILAYHAVHAGQIAAPFNGRYASGFSTWFVTGKGIRKRKSVQVFRNWLRDELEQAKSV